MMTVFSLLIAIRLGMSFLSVKVPGVSITLSFSWMPLMVLGWYFGPVLGIFGGMLMDTFTWLLRGGTWFWMYAIQEPVLGCIAGLLSSILALRKTGKNIVSDIIFNQIFILVFGFLTISLILMFADDSTQLFKSIIRNDKEINDDFSSIFRYVTIGFLCFFILFSEITIIVYLTRFKNKPKDFILTILYVTILVMTSTMLFSFALGPHTQLKFLQYVGKKPSSLYLKYGVNYYLLPRIIKESVKTPIYIIILATIITTFNYVFENIKKISHKKWKEPSVLKHLFRVKTKKEKRSDL